MDNYEIIVEKRRLSGKIPIHPDLNPYCEWSGDEGTHFHHDPINQGDYNNKHLPWPKYQVITYEEEPLPPCFYVYCQNTAVAVSMETGKIIGIKKKGRNPKIVKQIAKRLPKWLQEINIFYRRERKTNLQAIQMSWNHLPFGFSEEGKIINYEEISQHEDNQSENH